MLNHYDFEQECQTLIFLAITSRSLVEIPLTFSIQLRDIISNKA